MAVLLVTACQKEEPNLTVTGKVTGLKKGTLYLERLQDSILVPIDSMLVNGEPEFVLQTSIDEPEVLYLSLKATNKDNERIAFFANEGTTTIHTTLKRFIYDAKIEGGPEQSLWNTYNEMIANFNDENLDLIKAGLENAQDSIYLDSIEVLRQRNYRMRYQYTINYAKTHNSSNLAPYLLLREVSDANLSYLDTVYNSLSEEVVASKYGVALKEFIESRKTTSN